MPHQDDHDLLVDLCTRVEHLENRISEMVSKLEFAPVKIIAYGIVGICTSSILGAIVALVVRTTH